MSGEITLGDEAAIPYSQTPAEDHPDSEARCSRTPPSTSGSPRSTRGPGRTVDRSRNT
jgi:hypothetical protein